MRKAIAILALLVLPLLAGCASNGRPYGMFDFANWFSDSTGGRDTKITVTNAARATQQSSMAQTADSVSIYRANESMSEATRNPKLTVANAAQAVSEEQRGRKATFFNASRAIGKAQGR